jgi:hypothetical protein
MVLHFDDRQKRVIIECLQSSKLTADGSNTNTRRNKNKGDLFSIGHTHCEVPPYTQVSKTDREREVFFIKRIIR